MKTKGSGCEISEGNVFDKYLALSKVIDPQLVKPQCLIREGDMPVLGALFPNTTKALHKELCIFCCLSFCTTPFPQALVLRTHYTLLEEISLTADYLFFFSFIHKALNRNQCLGTGALKHSLTVYL